MSYDNVWEDRGVVTRFSGVVTGAEYLQSSRDIAADPRLDELRFVIKDFSQATMIDIGSEILDELAAIRFGVQATNPGARILLVGADPEVARLAETLRQPPLDGSHETRAFASIEEARRWFAVQPWLPTHMNYPHV
jgi:hypothetical protein